MTANRNFVGLWKLDRDFHYANSGRHAPLGIRSILSVANPALVASTLFRASAATSGPVHIIYRWLGLVFFASDVSTGATFEGPVEFPHPTGIVIGRGVRIGSYARVFQNVTIGSSRKGEYPVIGDNVTIYSGAVVAGNLAVGSGAIVGANCVVTRSVLGSDVIRRS